ncbi:MAG TPA: cytochrome c oxidase assembly factor CtaG [Virgibacillus sp.]|nr:cytochrome c oxidase assembly factor CtaG [Virgibacillus sp.]
MWLDIQIFGFRALWSPIYFLFLLGLSLIYYLVTGPYRKKFGDNARPTGPQQFYFYFSMLLLYIIKGSPIDLMTHITLTAHMMQMAIYYLVFPILIIKGIPAWIWKKVVNISGVKQVINVLTNPIIALLLFNGLFSLYHIPAIFDFSKSSQLAHASIGLVILVAAFVIWWPIMTPLEEYNTMRPILKIGYIFASIVLLSPACALIIFADHPLFAAYSQDGAFIQALALCVPNDVLQGLESSLSGPEMFTSMTTMEDQQLGGIVMQSVQEIMYGIVLGKVFFKWFNKESLKVDPLPVNAGSEPSHSNQH